MQKLKSILGNQKPVIGMIHLQALPGTPNNTFSSQQIIDIALDEAIIYKDAGIPALIIENMHDVPYIKEKVGHEVSSLMAVIAYLIKRETNLSLGIQVLAGANKQALAAANTSGADFIRAEGFVYGHVADEGYFDAQAGDLLRYRKQIGAEQIAVFTDIKKKHSSHSITQDTSLLDTAKAAEFFLSDGVIITGNHTGESASINDLESLKDKLNIPIIVGSGITIDNIKKYLPLCDAVIVGSHFKEQGHWKNRLNEERVEKFMNSLN